MKVQLIWNTVNRFQPEILIEHVAEYQRYFERVLYSGVTLVNVYKLNWNSK